MKFSIRVHANHIHAELRGRENSQDMREFLLAVKAACLEHSCPRILLSVHASHAMFKAEDYGLTGQTRGQTQGYVSELVTPSCRIALVGDTLDLNFAHEYIELVARQQQVNVRSFRDAASASRWLEAEETTEAPVAPGLDALKPGRSPKLA